MARSAVDLLKIHPNTAALFYKKIRQVIASHLAHDAQELFDGVVELDEIYKDKREKRFAEKIIVFGLLKRQGKVYTDSYRSSNALDVRQFHHEQVSHSTKFVNGVNHINGIENFWSQAKRVLKKYNDIHKESFSLFIKSCEFRFNYGSYKQQLKTLKNWCEI